ncbi:glycerate kinase [Flavivirga amylovorans]|uniref:Glycerate kinase n=1 Tax=Flavivirga amylovorans TaxID=870486 RepID=A0ABT8WZN6_9FLAO|nr:glycerate kinase [Flavivirga amylovorans]MDO5986933.1 glycerate kinase [Flavivirga amylovorans]
MKIVLAPDKFKNSLTGLEFCNAVEAGIKAITPNVEIVKLPLADGGDGTIEVVNYYLKGEVIHVTVNNPFFQPIIASYLYAKDSKTAFIEMAEASGVKLLKPEQFDCKNATTLGTGEMILDAIKKGASKIILGIGGSATNDCGTGMATALGYRFLDNKNNEVKPIGANLSQIESIDVSNVYDGLHEVDFSVACDVTNPMYGLNGAAHVYGAQKGASSTDIEMLDKGLSHFSKILNAVFNIDSQSVKGAGAAGGMGIASKVFLNGNLEPGIQLIKNLAQFDTKLENTDWIITGEGKLDTQTMSGKTIQGVLASAKAKQIHVAAFCGAIDLEGKNPEDFGIQYADAVMNYAKGLEDAMKNGYGYVKTMTTKFAKEFLK